MSCAPFVAALSAHVLPMTRADLMDSQIGMDGRRDWFPAKSVKSVGPTESADAAPNRIAS
jgi:hypothetical protein